MKVPALMLALALLPRCAAAQAVESMTPAGAYAQGARDGRAAARARAGAPGRYLAGVGLGLLAGRLTPRILEAPQRIGLHLSFAGLGILAGSAAGPIEGEWSFLERESERIASLPESYRFGYEEAYRAQFASIRRRDTIVAGAFFAAAAIALATLRQE